MHDWFNAFFDVRTLSPHGICLLWRPELLWTHVVADVLIGLAYFSIPAVLAVLVHRRPDAQFNWAVWLFVLFILLCGMTHFMAVWTLWRPDYGVEALLKAVTAVASVGTAIVLWPMLPKALAIPSASVLHARMAERNAAFSELQQAMATMVRMEEHQREQARLLDEVHRSEAKLRSIFESAAVGIARVAIDGRFLEVNDRFVEIAGWPREDLLARAFQEITHPEDLETDLGHIDALMRGQAGWFAMEKRYIRKDGGVVWAHLTASIIRNAAGEPDHFVSIIRDISEEKRTQQSRDLLMREVDHRARNALTVVQSVVRLTKSDDPHTFKHSVIGRVDALARAQASLSRANWTGSALRDVVVEELSSAAEPGQWRADGPEVLLPAATVQPLGMILHELSTNSLKYGALSAAGGEVAIDWTPRGEAGWRLTWTEGGGPAVAVPQRNGFGSRLINRLATEIGGAVVFHWRPEGLVVELSVAEARPTTTVGDDLLDAAAENA